jgi:hypothetical protein
MCKQLMNNIIVCIPNIFSASLRAGSHSTLPLFSSSTLKLSLLVSYAVLLTRAFYLPAAFLSL